MSLISRLCLFLGTSLVFTGAVFAWDGVDTGTGSSVEIGKGNLVRPGLDIEIYDYDAGEYRDVEVQSIRPTYGGVEVEVYDYDAGEYRTLEMDD